jgi:hypothetical protein
MELLIRLGRVREKVHLTGVSTSCKGKPSSAVRDIRTEEQKEVSHGGFYCDVFAWWATIRVRKDDLVPHPRRDKQPSHQV